jgi:hypothetical protein
LPEGREVPQSAPFGILSPTYFWKAANEAEEIRIPVPKTIRSCVSIHGFAGRGEIVALGKVLVEMKQLPSIGAVRRPRAMKGDRLPARVPQPAMPGASSTGVDAATQTSNPFNSGEAQQLTMELILRPELYSGNTS